MLTIPRKYIVDESNERVAVQLDIEAFEKLENLVADYVLGQILEKEKKEEVLDIDEAKTYYSTLIKKS